MTKRRRPGARTAATLLFLGVAVSACSLFDLHANPCPDPSSPLVCPNEVCCPNGSPYECDGKCYSTPAACSSSYVTCTGGTATPEIAGVRRDSGDFGGLMVDKDGEMLAVTVDRDAQGNATRVNGAVYTNASVSIAVFLGPDGLPTKTVIGDFVLLFANWNLVAKTVDVAKIYADTGYIEIVRRVPIDASELASDSTSTASQSSSSLHLDSTCFPKCDSVKKNIAETFKISAFILSAAACGEATAMSLGAMAIPCAGALVHAATLLAGDEAWVDDGEQAGLVLGAIGCTEGNPLECVSTAYGFVGAFLGTAKSLGSNGDLTTASGALANPSVGSGIVQQGGGPPACSSSYECNPYAYMPCYPDGTKQCSASCTWGACPSPSSGGCAVTPNCGKGTHQVGCECVSNGGGGGGGTCPDGSSCDSTGGHVCCGCADGSYMCLLPGLCAQGC